MQTGIGDTQNKWWQTYLSAGMATAPHPAQIDANGCFMEKENLIIPHSMTDIQNVAPYVIYVVVILAQQNVFHFLLYI